jgi:hypothetical protein
MTRITPATARELGGAPALVVQALTGDTLLADIETACEALLAVAATAIARERVEAVRRNFPSTSPSATAKARTAAMVDLVVELLAVDEATVIEAVDDVLAHSEL